MHHPLAFPDPRYAPAPLRDPAPGGFVHIAATVDPPRGPLPLVGASAARRRLLADVHPRVEALRGVAGVERVTVYEAALIPPAGSRTGPGTPLALAGAGDVLRGAPFDLALLVTTAGGEALDAVRSAPAYRALVETVTGAARAVHEVPARCVLRIADVDQVRPGGLFLFNHFVTGDIGRALALWTQIAGWYMAETSLDNSVVLRPLAAAPYAFVNHARWDASLPALARRQFAKPTFRSFVLANLRAAGVTAMPVLYRSV